MARVVELDFRGIVDDAPDALGVLDREQRHVFGNRALARLAQRSQEALVGAAGHELLPAEHQAAWKEMFEQVFASGQARELSWRIEEQDGPRRLTCRLTKLSELHLCARWRDISELHAGRVLSIAARTMATGMAVIEAPSGRVLFRNAEAQRLFGDGSRAARSQPDGAMTAYDAEGRALDSSRWPDQRALGGQLCIDERVEVEHEEGRRTVSINASPVRDEQGAIVAAVSTYHDVTEAQRRGVAARYLAAAGALLERFEPASLQAIVDLAVPALADWCFIHLMEGGAPRMVAIANADPGKAAAARERWSQLPSLPQDTAVARVLAGGPRELVRVDAHVLARAAQDPAHLAHLQAQGYRSAVVAPLPGREGVLGAVTFAMAESGRRYGEADLEMLTELARRTGIALDNARLLSAEQRARQHAEAAQDRTRRLQKLTEALSGAVEKEKVLELMVSAGADALGAASGIAWLLRDEATLELGAAASGAGSHLDRYRTIAMSTSLPVCDVVRTRRAMMFENVATMVREYPQSMPPASSPFKAWAVMPIVLGERAIGAVSFSFKTERAFSDEDRELLTALIGQASLAFERCRLLDAERRARSRERQLHGLAARLSSALTPEQVATIACEESVAVLQAYSGAVAVRVGEEVQILGIGGPRDDQSLAQVSKVPLAAAVPIAEAIRRTELIWCPNEVELAARYGHLRSDWHALQIRAWGAAPFAFEGGTLGSLAISFRTERSLDEGERVFLHGVGQLVAQALERARLYDALRVSEDQLRSALGAARAGTWRVDVTTMRSTRDPSFAALLDIQAPHAAADFGTVHPDDRPIARAHFERALREGVPYEPEVRMRRDDGSYLWIRAHGRIIRAADGTPVELAGVVVDIDDAKRASLRAEEERRINETLHRLGSSFGSELDRDRLIQLITEEVSKLVGAESGVFCHQEGGEGAAFTFHAGGPLDVERFQQLGPPRTTPLLAETLLEQRVVRVDDLLAQPERDSQRAPPSGQSPLRSYLAVPVAAHSGGVFGNLLFGHSEAGRFSADHERLATSIARQAAVALENARLYSTVRDQKEQLESAVERVRAADRRKDEFLAMLGHELRNPLAPIATALALMDLKGQGGMESERAVIRRQVEHLTRLVDDLLDVSRITRGKIALARRVVEVGGVLEKAMETVEPLLRRRGQRLELRAPGAGLPVDADPARLAQVFQNLLTNAAKYSDPGATISVRATSEAERVVVAVVDRGSGIPRALIPRVFDLFVQGERTIDRADGGLGIGLTIAKSLTELHGGTIEVESEGPGTGSTFTVRLPRASTQAAAPSADSTPALQRAASGKRVLVVDDNVDAAESLRELLEGLGHETAVAHDGMRALALASEFRPAIALLDIGLPVMDGYELARKLRASAGGDQLRLIAVTGYGEARDRTRALEAGFDHHLVKPLDLKVLLGLLA
jgi:signal transduction histidine kinase/PAS domain-containing protein